MVWKVEYPAVLLLTVFTLSPDCLMHNRWCFYLIIYTYSWMEQRRMYQWPFLLTFLCGWCMQLNSVDFVTLYTDILFSATITKPLDRPDLERE